MGDMWDAAQANIAVKYDPQQAALQRQLELSSKNTASNEQAIQGFGNTGRENITNNFATLYGLLGANKTDTQNALNQQLGLTNQGYDTAIQNIQGYQQNSRDYIAQMAAALGQSGQGLVSSGKLEDVANQQLGYANAARTNYGSTLSDWIAKMGSLSDMGIASAHQNEALKMSGFESDLINMLGQNKLAGTTQETDVINKIADLMNVRQSDLVDMYNQLTAAEWERQFKQAQLDQAAAEAAADLAYKYSALSSSEREGAANRSASANDDTLDWAKFNESVRQYDLGRGDQATEWGLKYAKDQTSERGDPADLQNLINAGLMGDDPGAANAYLSGGVSGLQNYNAEMGMRQQLQDTFDKLNTGGGGGGVWNDVRNLVTGKPQWAKDVRKDIGEVFGWMNPSWWNK
jgi:hypothetical protein